MNRRQPWDRSASVKRYAEKRKAKALRDGTFNSLDASRPSGGDPRETPRRRSTLARSGPIKPKKRTAAEKRRIYGTDDRIEWMHARPCEVCGAAPTEVCHTRSGGMGMKADARFTISLCRYHHREQHDIGAPAFQRRYALDLDALAAATEAAWREHNA